MRSLLILVLLLGAAYWFKPELYGFLNNKPQAFDEAGNPRVLFFTSTNCKEACQQAERLLSQRRITYETVVIDASKVNRDLFDEFKRNNNLPMLVVGSELTQGYYQPVWSGTLAKALGPRVLSTTERRYFERHFNEDGSPRIVMYGADWCPYCAKLRTALEENNLDYLEIDVEKSGEKQRIAETMGVPGYPTTYVGYERVNGSRLKDVEKVLARY